MKRRSPKPNRTERTPRPDRPEGAPSRPPRPSARATPRNSPPPAAPPNRQAKPPRPALEPQARTPRPRPEGFDRPKRGPRPRPDPTVPEERPDLIYGRNAVLEAARAGRVKRLLLATGLAADPRLDELRGLLPQFQEIPSPRLDVITGGTHQGVAAELKPRRAWSLRELLALQPDLLVALDSIQDPQNLGAIIRSAEAAGAAGAILPEHRAAPLSSAAVKASSGASELLRIARVAGMPSAIAEIKRAGIWCVALDPHGEMTPWEFDFTQPVCVVVGGEGPGVARLVRERCDARVRLPMAGSVASLNASAAAAVLLYEVTRQRALAVASSSQ